MQCSIFTARDLYSLLRVSTCFQKRSTYLGRLSIGGSPSTCHLHRIVRRVPRLVRLVLNCTVEDSYLLLWACRLPRLDVMVISHCQSADSVAGALHQHRRKTWVAVPKLSPFLRAVMRGGDLEPYFRMRHGSPYLAIAEHGNITSTALQMAASQGHADSCRTLLGHGADPNADFSARGTPLHLAARHGHLDACVALLEHGASADATQQSTPLWAAVAGGHTRVVAALLRHGASPNASSPDGTTVLGAAAHRGDLEMATQLMDSGAELDLTTREDGVTPLVAAILGGQEDMAALLLRRGCSRSICAPLWHAAGQGEQGIVSLLLHYCAPIDAVHPELGTTPLYAACEHAHRTVARVLLGAGADPNGSGPEEQPLQAAAEARDPELVQMLLEQGAVLSDEVKEMLVEAGMQGRGPRGGECVVM